MIEGSMNEYTQHLGEGIYASFDGYHIWLGTHGHPNEIPLDPDVFSNLVRYQMSLQRHLEKKECAHKKEMS